MTIKNMHSFVSNIVKMLDQAIFPHKCIFCNCIVEARDICINCFHKLKFYTKHSCIQCAVPIESFIHKTHKKCYECTTHNYYFDRIITIFYYNDIVAENIHKFKFFDKISYAKTYADYLLPNINKEEFDIIIPVPLHYFRLITRRYNQANELAKKLNKHLKLPLYNNVLYKLRNTKPQRTLTFVERLKNLEGAFGVKNSSLLEGKRVLLVDDVVTTAVTINECSKILKQNGAKYVAVATVARSVKS